MTAVPEQLEIGDAAALVRRSVARLTYGAEGGADWVDRVDRRNATIVVDPAGVQIGVHTTSKIDRVKQRRSWTPPQPQTRTPTPWN